MTEITSRCFFLLLVAASLHAQMLSSVRPDSGKVGAVLRVHGSELSKEKIDSVYLSDQTLDMMVKVLNQTDNFIEFRIPPSVKARPLSTGAQNGRQATADPGNARVYQSGGIARAALK